MPVAGHARTIRFDTAPTPFANGDITRVLRRRRVEAPDRMLDPSGEQDVGACAGPFVLREVVARGGFGNVYRSAHALLGRQIAIKLMRLEHRDSPEVRLRFLREARLANLVDHPGVVQIHDAGEMADGRVWLAMEMLAGEDLGQLLDRERQLTLARTLAVLAPLCEAVDAIHAVGVVHRDLKPANVFLDRRGKGRVVVVDFGVAKRLGDLEAPVTAVDHVIGTPSCMAPEQLRGQDVDARADIYALGALAYQMLSGVCPFGEGPPLMTRHLHLFGCPPRLSVRTGLPGAVDDVIERALAKSPAKRPTSATELFEDLKRAGRTRRRSARSSTTMASAIGVSVQLLVASGRWPLDGLARDLAKALHEAGAALEREGFTRALSGASSLLYVKRLPESADAELVSRRETLTVVSELARCLGSGGRLHTNLAVHVGEVAFADGMPVAGALLRVSEWAPDHTVLGVAASPVVVAGLAGLVTTPVDDHSGLVRVTGGLA